MKFITIVTSVFLFVGCSSEQVAHSITKTQITMSGNKPPAFFKVANIETMRDYVFEARDFSFQFPSAKPSDFSKMDGWNGTSMRDGKTISFGFNHSIVYHFSLSTSGKVSDYSERDRAIDTHDVPYIRARFHKYHPDTKISIKNYGQESYDCIVIEDSNYNKWNKKDITYSCHKFNPARTKAKQVSISLTYNKPKDPKLAKQYTYEDLKRRAKRTLDSLYITDGW